MTETASRSGAGFSAVQAAAVLTVCRLAAFFCDSRPYSASYAKGMSAAALLTAGLLLPLLLPRTPLPDAVLRFCRLYALLTASLTLVRLRDLLFALHSPYPRLTLFLLLPVLLELQRLPQAASARAATLLLFVTAAAFLLLPVSGLRTARLISLYTPDSSGAAFLREFQQSGELGILPLLIRQEKKPHAAARGAAAWLIFRAVLLPLTVLFGAAVNGRLLHLSGNPFFLLLARTPLSDAFRADGFWMLLAVGCMVLNLTLLLQLAAGGAAPCLRYGIILPFACFALLFAILPDPSAWSGRAALLSGTVLPAASRFYDLCGRLPQIPRPFRRQK